ncbi:hypothetical protein SDC9_198818 [bioreactor metagenome]|uniref:SLH domain-containing protein n=1 Tax=bioreactor metagenome TaxID=1076179 RepID=A0A645IJK7_9ZZZZ
MSDWAKPELQTAYDLGLIPDILIDADMTKPITREEFCELAVLLDEKVTGQAVQPVSPDPFTDTANPHNIAGVKDFPDQALISGWAVDAAKYMCKIGVITGDAQGNFMVRAARFSVHHGKRYRAGAAEPERAQAYQRRRNHLLRRLPGQDFPEIGTVGPSPE